jgi:ribose transport system permease protein
MNAVPDTPLGAPPMPLRARAWLRQGAWLAVALVCAGFALGSPLFLTLANLGNVLQQSAVTGLLALGLTIVMIGGGDDAITGGLDLSIAANLGWCAAVFAVATRAGLGDALACALTFGAGAAVGALNAWAVTRLRILPLLATLTTMNLCAGLELVLTQNTAVEAASPLLGALLEDGPFGVPRIGCALLAAAAVLGVAVHRTPWGLHLRAVGAHRAAAAAAGIPAARRIAASYVASGIAAAFAALASGALLSGSAPGSGDNLLPVVAAVLLGAVFSRRFVPTIPGTLVAVLFVGMLVNGFQLNNLSSYWVNGVEGALILFVVAATAFMRRRHAGGRADG